MSWEIGGSRDMNPDRNEAPPTGEMRLRRPRDGRRRPGAGGTGPLPVARGVPQARTAGTPPGGLTSGGVTSGGVTGPIRQLLGPVTGSLRLGRGRGEGGSDQRIRVDWPQCKAHGLCAEIAPELIRLDEWGYPVFDAGGLHPDDVATARKAVQVCPTLALRLTEVRDAPTPAPPP